jgi:hyperosmotically inducible periplasmic protein
MPAAAAWALVIWVAALAGCQTTSEQTAAQSMRDASVSAAVQMKLTGDRTSNFARVDVESQGGIVHLTGVVPSPEEKSRAEELAGQVDGVQAVRNSLQVRRGSAENRGAGSAGNRRVE